MRMSSGYAHGKYCVSSFAVYFLWSRGSTNKESFKPIRLMLMSTNRIYLRRVSLGLVTGASCGMILGALLLGARTWLNESSTDDDWESQWVYIAVLVGLKLGLILGALVGSAVGLVSAITHQRK